jgi:guanine deaminase
MNARITGHLLLPDTDQGVRLAPGTLVIRGERIESVMEGLDPNADLGGEDYFITPGFVDAHVHLPQFDSIGVDGLELLDWLKTAIFPAEAKWKDAAYAAEMAGRVAQELLSFGTTAVAAYATVHHEGTQAAIEALAREGIAGHVGQVLMDRNAPPELLSGAKESLESAARLRGAGRIAPAVTPRFAITCSEELLLGAAQLARATGWYVQTHLAETRREIETVQALFPGETYTGVYERTGLLTKRTLLGHCVWLEEADLATVRRHGAIVAHCPTANRFLDAGVMKRAKIADAGVRMALGSDVAGGPDRSMVRIARGMIEAAKASGSAIPTGAQCWAQITRWNADLLGLKHCGSLEAGRYADVLVIRPTTRWWESPDVLSHLIYAWDDRWLRATIAAGEVRWKA